MKKMILWPLAVLAFLLSACGAENTESREAELIPADILESVKADLQKLKSYQMDRDLTLVLDAPDLQDTSVTTQTASISLPNDVAKFDADVGNDEKLEMYTEGDMIYLAQLPDKKWIKVDSNSAPGTSLAFTTASDQLSRPIEDIISQLEDSADNITVSATESAYVLTSKIQEASEVPVMNEIAGFDYTAAPVEVHYEFDALHFTIMIDKETNYPTNIKLEADMLMDNREEEAAADIITEMKFSDFSKTETIELPAEVKQAEDLSNDPDFHYYNYYY